MSGVGPVQYVRTSDGVNIAYAVRGSGRPVVTIWPPVYRSADMLAIDPLLIAPMKKARAVVSFDHRGCGDSDRVIDFELDSLVRDVEAVINAVGGDSVDLFATSDGCAVAIATAAQHPDRVGRLVLRWPYISGAQLASAPGLASIEQHLSTDWRTATDSLGLAVAGWDDPRTGRLIAEAMRAGSTQEATAEFVAKREEWDLSADLERIESPTLIVATQNHPLFSAEHARAVAAAINRARLVIAVPPGGEPSLDAPDVADAVFEFLDVSTRPATRPPAAVQTILFTDLEASTPLTQRLGDEGAQDLLRGHNATVRGALRDHGGREVKHTGDGIMASFPSAVAAVTAALQIQRELAGGEVRVRVGLNAGEPIAEDDDLFGLSVIKAARVADRAEPGQVLVSRVVRELCEGKTFQFTSLGEVQLKGFDEAVELFEVAG